MWLRVLARPLAGMLYVAHVERTCHADAAIVVVSVRPNMLPTLFWIFIPVMKPND